MRTPLVPEDQASLRDNNFNTLRLIMAVLVVWSHSFALFKGSENTEPVSLLFNGNYNSGNIGVLAFFVISGFLIPKSFQQSKRASDFLKKRIFRIYPGFVAAVFICSFVVVPIFSGRNPFHLRNEEVAGLLSNLALKGYIIPSDAFGGHAVNGSLWSISFEFWCYLGVLALGVSGLGRIRFIWPVIALITMLVRTWLDLTDRHPASVLAPIIGYAYFWFMVLPPFALGASVLLYGKHISRSRWLLLGLIGGTIAAAHLPVEAMYATALTRLMLPPALCYATLYAAFSPVRLFDAAKWGDISYGTYLYAFPIQQAIGATILTRIGFAGAVLTSIVSSLIAGALSWMLIERWFVHVRKNSRRLPLAAESTLVAP